MDIKNFSVRKKCGRSINSMDGDEKKRPRKASSFNDSIAKAANNGEVQRSIKIRWLYWDFMKLYEKFGRDELFQITSSTTDSQIKLQLKLN